MVWEDAVMCPHCFSVLVLDDGSLISCTRGGLGQSAAQPVQPPHSDEGWKQAREAANRDADRRLEREQQNEWEAKRAQILGIKIRNP